MNAEDAIRDLLVKITSAFRNESLAGALFAVGLILTDHALNVVGGVKKWLPI